MTAISKKGEEILGRLSTIAGLNGGHKQVAEKPAVRRGRPIGSKNAKGLLVGHTTVDLFPFELKEPPELHSWTMKKLIKALHDGEIDLDPAYQRNADVWSEKYRRDLIGSILEPLYIGAIHLIRQPKGAPFKWECMDGKQRLTAILDFVAGKFSIGTTTTLLDPATKEVVHKKKGKFFYDDLTKTLATGLWAEFISYSLSVVEWAVIDNIEAKAKAFAQINQSSNLNTQEKLYCPNFLCRDLFRGIFNYVCGPIRKHFVSKIADGKRFMDVRAMHELHTLLYGQDPNITPTDDAVPYSVSSSDIKSSAVAFHNWMLSAGYKDKLDVTEDVLQEHGFLVRCRTMRRWAKALAEVYSSDDKLPRFETRNFVDPLAWLICRESIGWFTCAEFAEHRSDWSERFKLYFVKKNDFDLNRATTDDDTMEAKFKLLDCIWEEVDAATMRQSVQAIVARRRAVRR